MTDKDKGRMMFIIYFISFPYIILECIVVAMYKSFRDIKNDFLK